MARVNINIFGISELKWTGMGEFNSDDHCILLCKVTRIWLISLEICVPALAGRGWALISVGFRSTFNLLISHNSVNYYSCLQWGQGEEFSLIAVKYQVTDTASILIIFCCCCCF